MTLIRPRLRISRHFVQILRTEALIFIFPYLFLNYESNLLEKISLFALILELRIYYPRKKKEKPKPLNLWYTSNSRYPSKLP